MSQDSASLSTIRNIHQWNSPERRSSDHKQLSPIPLEIYLEIIDHIRPRDGIYISPQHVYECMNSLRNLALVCRYFCAQILPCLYKVLIFCPKPEEESLGNRRDVLSRTFIPFCQDINRGEAFAESLALEVTQCDIRDWIDVPSETLDTSPVKASLDALIEALPAMTNLTSIVLSRTTLTPTLLENILRLEKLASLRIQCCDLAGMTTKVIHDFASRVKLQTFHFFSNVMQDEQLVSSAGASEKELLSLLMNVSTFGTDSWPLISAMIASDAVPSFQTLDIFDILDPAALCDFLCRISTLTSLTLDGVAPTEDSYFLVLSNLKQLRHLSCPPCLISRLSGSQKLSTLSFYTRAHQSEDPAMLASFIKAGLNSWKAFSQFRSLRELCLPLIFMLLITVDPLYSPHDAKELRKLTVFSDGTATISREFIISDPIFMDGGPMDDNVKDAFFMWGLLRIIGQQKHFPKLEWFTFHGLNDRTWKWRNEGMSGKWRPFQLLE
ncbi:hypothetical protein F5879DRAFT_990813 [Lentinula edodes]|nr:hypothetical protein F5879DRAFT_990813 [Lentinula edodes]